MSLPTQAYTVTRADLVRYAQASGDDNPIHQDEEVARSVGLPGVIAHGMYTMALAARAVSTWFPGAEVERRVVAQLLVLRHARQPSASRAPSGPRR